MTLRRKLIRLMDIPGGRLLLALVATRIARKRTNRNVTVFFRGGVWAHRFGSQVFVDSAAFDYNRRSFIHWMTQQEDFCNDAKDFWFHEYCPREGDVIVDVGAGRGEHLLAMCQAVGITGRIIAIEADPESFLCLSQACALNGLTQVKALHCAIVDRRGRVTINVDKSWQENTVKPTSDDSDPDRTVAGITLDDLIVSEHLDRVDLLKMNIEGSEILAISGLITYAKRVRHVCVSCHDFRFLRGEGEQYRTREGVVSLLQKKGFTTVARIDPRPYIRDQILAYRD